MNLREELEKLIEKYREDMTFTGINYEATVASSETLEAVISDLEGLLREHSKPNESHPWCGERP